MKLILNFYDHGVVMYAKFHQGVISYSAAAEVTKSDMYPYRKGNK